MRSKCFLPLILVTIFSGCLPSQYNSSWLKKSLTLRSPSSTQDLSLNKEQIHSLFMADQYSHWFNLSQNCLTENGDQKSCRHLKVQSLALAFAEKYNIQNEQQLTSWENQAKLELDQWYQQSQLSLYSLVNFKKEQQDLQWQLSNLCDARAIYFESFNAKNPQKKYQTKMNLCLERFKNTHAKAYSLVAGQYRYQNQFWLIADQVKRELELRMGEVSELISQSSKELIESCRPSSWHPISFHPFHGGDLYIRPEILGCINHGLPGKLDQLIKNKLGGDYLHAKAAIVYLESLYLPAYLQQLQTQLQLIHKDEEQLLAENDLVSDHILWEKLYQKHLYHLSEQSADYDLTCQQMIKSDLSQHLQNKLDGKQKTMTIAFHEEATKVAQEYCFRFKSKKSMETSAELAQIDRRLDQLHRPAQLQWFARIRTMGHYMAGCRENIQAEIALQVNQLIKTEFRHFSKEKILSLALERVCTELKTDFVTAVDRFDASLDQLDLPQTFAKVINNNLGWGQQNDQQQMLRVCEDDHSYALTGQNVYPQYTGLSSQIKAQVVAKRICQLATMAWQDLKAGAASMDPACFQDCWRPLREKIAEYFVDLPPTVWAVLDQQREQVLINRLLAQMDRLLNEQISECKQNSDPVKKQQCLTNKVFYPQNFSNLVSKIYPSGKKITAEHMVQMDQRFKQKGKIYLSLIP